MERRLILVILLMAVQFHAWSQVNIWEGTSCGKKVMMTPYVAPGKDNPGIIVCPGGSYFWHDMEVEGHDVGRWLRDNGISAFVLKYRTAAFPAFFFHFRYLFRGNRYPDPQDDLRQAIRWVRQHATEYGVDKNVVGAMGFSAGGHLVMSSVELFDREDWPAFVIPVYPVVTMVENCTHKRSRRGLLGESRTGNRQLRDLLSLERHVPQDCPPVFLINCLDDPIVDFRNSVLLDSALSDKNIPHQYIQFQTGGHGFGASEKKLNTETRQWKMLFLKWLNSMIRHI